MVLSSRGSGPSCVLRGSGLGGGGSRLALVLHQSGPPSVLVLLPSVSQADLQAAELLVGVEEELQLTAAPGPPDHQGPLRVLPLETTNNRVLRHQRRRLQSPDGTRRETGHQLKTEP